MSVTITNAFVLIANVIDTLTPHIHTKVTKEKWHTICEGPVDPDRTHQRWDNFSF